MSQEGSENTASQGGTAGSPMKKNPVWKSKNYFNYNDCIILYCTNILYFTNLNVILVCWLWSKNDDCQFV